MQTITRAAAVLALAAASLPADAATATVTRAWQFKPESAGGLEINNLIGEIRVERGAGPGFHVTAVATVDADSQAEADRLLKLIQFRTRDVGAGSRFDVFYSKDDFPKLRHEQGSGFWWSWMYVEHLGERIRFTRDSDDAPAVRVDIVVRGPAGAKLAVDNVFGEQVARGYSGELRLDGGSGALRSSGGEGRLVLDNGSGDIDVQGHRGEVDADNGSGGVTIANCECEIEADTGSGRVEIKGGSGRLRADTGSGTITVDGFRGRIGADTGSGSVRAKNVAAVEELDVDTGSGSLSVDGDLSALRRLRVDTGSGSVRLHSSGRPSIEIRVDTGSGHVDVDAPGATVREDDDGTWIIKAGDGAGTGIIDTGSGSVNITFP